MKNFRKLLSVILATISIISVCTIFASAETNEPELFEIYKDHTGYTMVAARKGSTKNAPENSIAAIQNAENEGADIIEIDIRATSDGVLILMEDETVTRTTCNYDEDTVVAEMTYDEIKDLTLLMGHGGKNADVSAEKVPSLQAVFDMRKSSSYLNIINKVKKKSLFMLDFEWALRDDIAKLVADNNMQNDVIFYINDASADEIAEWKESLSFEPMIMSYFKGNVIFAATANVKEDSAFTDGIHLATKNPYGVIFGENVQNTAYDSGIRTMASPCMPEICGSEMQDTEIWWDKLVSIGFNIILTDDVKGLREYVDNCGNKALELESAIKKYITNWELPDFKQDKFLDYKRAYTNAADKAETLINRDKSRSFSDIATAVYELQKAAEDININYDSFEDGSAGKTITPVTIILAILAVAAVTVAEIYVFRMKKTEKKKSSKKAK